MVAPESASERDVSDPRECIGITDDRLVLERALLQRVVLTAGTAPAQTRTFGDVPPIEAMYPDPSATAGSAGLRAVEPIGEIARIYDDAQLDVELPAAFVAFRGERIEAPASVRSVAQAAHQSWSVVLVVPMRDVLDTGASVAGPLVARLEAALRGWTPLVWVEDAETCIDGVGPLVRITGDPPLHEWERQIVAIDLRYESRLQGA